MFRNGPRPSRMSRVIVRVDANVRTKARKHKPSGSLPATITSRCHHEPMPLMFAESRGHRAGAQAAGQPTAAADETCGPACPAGRQGRYRCSPAGMWSVTAMVPRNTPLM